MKRWAKILTGSLWGCLVALSLSLQQQVLAEDIDLFVGAPAASGDKPNVLILLDNTANWSRKNSSGVEIFKSERAALSSTVTGLPADKFRLGMMMFTETSSGDSNTDGGYVRAAVRDLDSTYKSAFTDLVANICDTRDRNDPLCYPAPSDFYSDKGNNGKLGLTMMEAYRYYSGLAPYAGNDKNKTDYTGNTYGSSYSQAVYALAGNALSSKTDTSYASPIVAGSCANNYIIYISNGAAQDNRADTTTATNELTAAGGDTTTIPLSPSGSQDNIGDEWARFLKSSALNITTYTVDVDKVTTGQGPGWSALLRSMASVSGGKYFDVSSDAADGADISEALNTIFSEIQSVSSVFASVSLPVSVNTQGTYLNQVYVGMFRPDQNALPQWVGNLKQYKLAKLSGALKLVDADGVGAINTQTGFVTECARAFWTPTTTDSYWAFRPQGACLAVANSDVSNYPDGNVVEKGAQAYVLRQNTTRPVKTCSTTFASCTSLTDFNNTNVTQAMLGAADATERDELINWILGLDEDDEDIDAVTSEMRPSAHGDVLHSRPVALNYGTVLSPSVVVFYGGNDGVLRAVNGNRSAAIGSVPAGDELWGFIPPEFYTQIKRLRDNDVPIDYFGSTASPRLPKPYALDGAVSAYKDASDAWIYSTMRRGGRVLYAFDVTDPASPSIKWKVGCPNLDNDTDCSTGFTEMGQTWSAPKTFFSDGYGGGGSPLLIMGGGYDTCEDDDPQSCTGGSSDKGSSIYVMDADTGALQTTFATDRGVIGDITVVPDSTGKGIYAYVADLGGNLYRIAMGAVISGAWVPSAPAAWTMTKIASLGCDTVTSCSPNRKFMFAPDVVEENGKYIILVGSGDREKPLAGYTNAASVSNYFFMVQDNPSDATWLSSESATCGSSVLCRDSLWPITSTTTPSQADLDTKKGWYLGMSSGEQVVTASITIYGNVTFSTHTPAVYVAGSCTSTLGTAKVYNIRYTDASPTDGSTRYENISGGGLPPSPVAGLVNLDDGSTVPFIIGADPGSPLEATEPPTPPSSSVNQPKIRTYWYIQQ